MLDNAKNFAKGTVSAGYDTVATDITLSAGDGAKFPAAPFNAVWWNATDYPDPSDDPSVEIVRVTAIAADTLTVTRAQEGTAATAKNTAGKTYKMLAGLTAKVLNDDLPQRLFSQTSVQAGDTITGGVGANTLFASQCTIPADTLKVGTVIEFEAWGVLTVAAGDQYVTQMMLGGAAGSYIGNLGKIYQNNALANAPWRIRGRLICTATGTNGTVEGTAEYIQNTNNAVNQLDVFSAMQPVTALYTVDTTVAQVLAAAANYSWAAASTATQRGCIVVKL